MQDFDVFGSESLFFLSTPLKVTKQGIGNSDCFVLLIIDPELVTRELLGPANLFGAQILCVHEPAEVVVVDKYKHLMLRPF